MKESVDMTRRRILGASVATGGLAASGALLSVQALAADKAAVNMQLGWLAGGNQIGEVAAKRLGYYEQEGIEFSIQPGGPNIDGVALIASGRYESGQVSSSPSIMLAAWASLMPMGRAFTNWRRPAVSMRWRCRHWPQAAVLTSRPKAC